MPRNPSGDDYSIPFTFTQLNIDGSRRLISSDEVNANFTDLADAIVDSLPRDGRAPMTGQMKAAVGTEEEPGITFAGDLDTGIYWQASGTFALVSNGEVVATVSSAGIINTAVDPKAENDAYFFATAL